MADDIQLPPGVPVEAPPAITTAPYDPAQAYDAAAATRDPAATEAAWAALAASGDRPSPARVYPPTDPNRLATVQIGPPRQTLPAPSNDILDLAQQYNVPTAAATTAVIAQMKYQAQRGYQHDLEQGMSAQDAITKWGPLLLGAGSTRSLYPQTQFRTAGGQGYAFDPRTGTATPVTPPAPQKPSMVHVAPGLVAVHRDLLSRFRAISALRDAGKMDATDAARQLYQLQRDRLELEKAHPDLMGNAPAAAGGDTSTGTEPPPAVAPPTGATKASPAASPFREGQIVRSKTTGKQYRIVNGKPVPL